MGVDIECCVLALFFNFEATAAIVGDYADRELASSGSKDLLEMLPRLRVELNRSILRDCLSFELWVKRLSFDSDHTPKVFC